MRNLIISEYEQDRDRFLTATHCRQFLTGDVCTILRVHRFLDDWGFINSDAKRPEPVTAAHFHSAVLTNENPAFVQAASFECARLSAPSLFLEPSVKVQPADWSREDDAQLLKAAETHKLDWKAVCEAIPNRSESECVKRFISLSVADTLNADRSAASVSKDKEKSKEPSQVLARKLASDDEPEAMQVENEGDVPADSNAGATPVQLNLEKGLFSKLKKQASHLSTQSEREAQATMQQLMGLQMQRINIKLDHWERMRQIMLKERHQLEEMTRYTFASQVEYQKAQTSPTSKEDGE